MTIRDVPHRPKGALFDAGSGSLVQGQNLTLLADWRDETTSKGAKRRGRPEAGWSSRSRC